VRNLYLPYTHSTLATCANAASDGDAANWAGEILTQVLSGLEPPIDFLMLEQLKLKLIVQIINLCYWNGRAVVDWAHRRKRARRISLHMLGRGVVSATLEPAARTMEGGRLG
jgi:hypothetical protein